MSAGEISGLLVPLGEMLEKMMIILGLLLAIWRLGNSSVKGQLKFGWST